MNEARACEQNCTEVLAGAEQRDFELNEITYFEGFTDETVADQKNHRILSVKDFDATLHPYQLKMKVSLGADKVFTQIQVLLN